MCYQLKKKCCNATKPIKIKECTRIYFNQTGDALMEIAENTMIRSIKGFKVNLKLRLKSA